MKHNAYKIQDRHRSIEQARATADHETEWTPYFAPSEQEDALRELQIVVENLSKRITALEMQIERIPA